MAVLRAVSGWIARFRAQRWSKEILLAVVLTLAAVVFIVAAMGEGGQQIDAVAPFVATDQ